MKKYKYRLCLSNIMKRKDENWKIIAKELESMQKDPRFVEAISEFIRKTTSP